MSLENLKSGQNFPELEGIRSLNLQKFVSLCLGDTQNHLPAQQLLCGVLRPFPVSLPIREKSSNGDSSAVHTAPPIGSNQDQNIVKKRVLETTGDDPEKRHCVGNHGGDDGGDDGVDDEYLEGFPPKGVAKHGPAFLSLSKEEREWVKRVHHRMGHPDPKKFAVFLKDTHADPKIIAGALEYQCDACGESQTGYSLARPAAIHAHLTFNEVIGMDTASWTNDQGLRFTFVHFLDDRNPISLGKTVC